MPVGRGPVLFFGAVFSLWGCIFVPVGGGPVLSFGTVFSAPLYRPALAKFEYEPTNPLLLCVPLCCCST